MNKVLEQKLAYFRSEVEKAGEELRDVPLPELTEEAFGLFETNGNRLIYENLYFPRRKQLAVFGLLSIWYGREADVRKLEAILREICRERCWALPAHVSRKEKDWEITVDLFASETAQALSEITALLGDRLSEEVRNLVKEEVTRRIFDSYMSRPLGGWNWESYENNWVAVCAGSIGSAAMHLLNDQPEKQKRILDRVLETMPRYLDSIMEDGTCPEGILYFTYGMTYFTGFAEQMYRFSGGKVNLMDNPKVERAARFQQACYFDSGLTVSFSDGSQRDRYRLGLTCYLASLYPGVELPAISSAMNLDDDSCYRFMALLRDDAWVRTYGESVKAPSEDGAAGRDQWLTVLPAAQWAVGKGDRGTGFAVKGGHNDEPHNHNDIGTFLYLAGRDMFLTDLGGGEYTKDYFSDKRYGILNNRSLGHSLPLADGKEQLAGRAYCADAFHAEEETVKQGHEEQHWAKTEVSFGGAYEEGLFEKALRSLRFCRETGQLQAEDRFWLKHAKTVAENLVTQYEPQMEGNGFSLRGQDGVLRIRVEELADFKVEKETFSNHQGQEEVLYRIQWLLKTEDGKAESRFTADWEPAR